MKTFVYTITDPLGIHARPAGLLTKVARAYPDTTITIAKDGNTVRASQLMKLMGMGVRQGDTVTVEADGASEESAFAALWDFFQNNL